MFIYKFPGPIWIRIYMWKAPAHAPALIGDSSVVRCGGGVEVDKESDMLNADEVSVRISLGTLKRIPQSRTLGRRGDRAQHGQAQHPQDHLQGSLGWPEDSHQDVEINAWLSTPSVPCPPSWWNSGALQRCLKARLGHAAGLLALGFADSWPGDVPYWGIRFGSLRAFHLAEVPFVYGSKTFRVCLPIWSTISRDFGLLSVVNVDLRVSLKWFWRSPRCWCIVPHSNLTPWTPLVGFIQMSWSWTQMAGYR